MNRSQQHLALGAPKAPGARQKAAIPVIAAAEDQGVDVVRALIGVDRLQIGGVAHHLEFGRDAVAAVHVARDAGDVERLAAIVALDQADRLGDQLALVEPPPDAQRRLQAEA